MHSIHVCVLDFGSVIGSLDKPTNKYFVFRQYLLGLIHP